MAVSPTGMLSLPIDYLRDTIANSSTFQTWTGTANATAAKARTHVGRAAGSATHPLACVGYSSGFRRFSNELDVWQQDNVLQLLFRDDFSRSLNESDAYDTFANQVGAVMEDMEALFNDAGYLDVFEWAIITGPNRTTDNDEQTMGYFFEVIIECRYGGV